MCLSSVVLRLPACSADEEGHRALPRHLTTARLLHTMDSTDESTHSLPLSHSLAVVALCARPSPSLGIDSAAKSIHKIEMQIVSR